MHFIQNTILFYLALTIIMPVLRHRYASGSWPITFHKGADPFQAFIGMQLMIALMLGGIWAIALPRVAPASLHLMSTSPWVTVTGWYLLLVGALFEVFSQIYMGRSFRVGNDTARTELVTTGPFWIMRNPVFTGLIIALAGIVLITPSPYSIMGFVWISSLIHIQVRLEEAHMLKMHGDTYARYARRTGRFLPMLGRLSTSTSGASITAVRELQNPESTSSASSV